MTHRLVGLPADPRWAPTAPAPGAGPIELVPTGLRVLRPGPPGRVPLPCGDGGLLAADPYIVALMEAACPGGSCPGTQTSPVQPVNTKQLIDDYGMVSPSAFADAGGVAFLNVVDFGASFDDDPTQDDGVSINLAIQAALEIGVGAVYIPHGTYNIGTAIQLKPKPGQWLRVFGDYPMLKASPSLEFNRNSVLLDVDTSGSGVLSVERLVLQCALHAKHGIFGKISGAKTVFREVGVTCARSHGVRLYNGTGGLFIACQSVNNRGSGWRISGCNTAIFFGCEAKGNCRAGFAISDGSPGFPGSCTVAECWVENNAGDGIVLAPGTTYLGKGMTQSSGPRNVRIRNCWIEGNGEQPGSGPDVYPIRLVEAKGCVIVGNEVILHYANGSPVVYPGGSWLLLENSKGTLVMGNSIGAIDGESAFAQPLVVPASAEKTLEWIANTVAKTGLFIPVPPEGEG